MKKLIAYCGLDCEKCDARIATITNDNQLRKETAEKWCKMNHTDQITPESINCMGCRTEGIKFVYCDSMCGIRKCAISKGLETCGCCSELDTCQKVAMIISNNKEARKNLKTGYFPE